MNSKASGIDMDEADARYAESLDLILKAWTSDKRWNHKGKFWTFEDVIVEPPTIQKPHPPIWFAAGRPGPIREAARRGGNLLIDQYCPLDEVIKRVSIFRDQQKKIGREEKSFAERFTSQKIKTKN